MTKVVIAVLIAVVLVSFAVIGWTFGIMNRIAVNNKDNEIAGHHEQATAVSVQSATAQIKVQTTATAQAANWYATQASLNTAQEKIQATASEQQRLLGLANEAISTLTQDKVSQSTQIADLRDLSASQYGEIDDYESTVLCSSRPSAIDYTSNATVSASLELWLEAKYEDISTADWEIIWNGPETAYHYLQGEYYYVYIVYFDEPDYYNSSSVYDVYSHCFLDH